HDKLVGSYDLDPILRSRSCKDKNDPKWDRDLDSLGFNINSAQHTCMVFELRLRYEHEIMTREKFQKKFIDTCAVVQQRDAEIAALGTRLEKDERDAAEVVSLRGHVSELEAGVAVKSPEVDTLGTQNAELSSKVSALESERGELM
ncbi:hypothetical protein Tco_0045726, partial [Tanacetum coccineum]